MVARSLRALDSNRCSISCSAARTGDAAANVVLPTAKATAPLPAAAAGVCCQSPCFDIATPVAPSSHPPAAVDEAAVGNRGASSDAAPPPHVCVSPPTAACEPSPVDEEKTTIELFPAVDNTASVGSGGVTMPCERAPDQHASNEEGPPSTSASVGVIADVEKAAALDDESDRAADVSSHATNSVAANERSMSPPPSTRPMTMDATKYAIAEMAGDDAPEGWSRSVSLSLTGNSPSVLGGGGDHTAASSPDEGDGFRRQEEQTRDNGSTMLIGPATQEMKAPDAVTVQATRRELLLSMLHDGAHAKQMEPHHGARQDLGPEMAEAVNVLSTASADPAPEPRTAAVPPTNGAVAFVTEFRESVERTRASILSRLSDERGPISPQPHPGTTKRQRDSTAVPSASDGGADDDASPHRTERQRKATEAVDGFLSRLSSDADNGGFLWVKLKDALAKYASATPTTTRAHADSGNGSTSGDETSKAAIPSQAATEPRGAERCDGRLLMPLGTMMRILLRFVRATNALSVTRQLTLPELCCALIEASNRPTSASPDNTAPSKFKDEDDEDDKDDEDMHHRPSAVEAMLSMAIERNNRQPFVAVVQRRRVSGNHMHNAQAPPAPSMGGARAVALQPTGDRPAVAIDRRAWVVDMNRVTSCMHGLRQRLSVSPVNQLPHGHGHVVAAVHSPHMEASAAGLPVMARNHNDVANSLSGEDAEEEVLDTIDVPIRGVEYDIHSHSLCDVQRFIDSMQRLRRAVPSTTQRTQATES